MSFSWSNFVSGPKCLWAALDTFCQYLTCINLRRFCSLFWPVVRNTRIHDKLYYTGPNHAPTMKMTSMKMTVIGICPTPQLSTFPRPWVEGKFIITLWPLDFTFHINTNVSRYRAGISSIPAGGSTVEKSF